MIYINVRVHHRLDFHQEILYSDTVAPFCRLPLKKLHVQLTNMNILKFINLID